MWVILALTLLLTLTESQAVTFDLSDYDPKNSTTATQQQFVNLTRGVTVIAVTNVPETVGFFILQVHSYPYNVTLSTKGNFKDKYTVSGTNVGLATIKQKGETFYLKTLDRSSVLIVVSIYQSGDPVPGGCNLSFHTKIAPYQVTLYTDELIIVQSQAPSAKGTTCDKDNITVELYHLYLPENNYKMSHYFNGIQKMLTVDTIKTNGYKVKSANGYFKYRKLYSAYRGVGQVFGIIATYRNRSSAYIPAISYGCDLTNEESCNGPITAHWKLICALLLICGCFVCFVGHKFFRVTLYLMGFTIGVFTTYVIMSISYNLTVAEMTTASLIIGLVYGSLWVLLWWIFGIPILSVCFTFCLSGFLMASIIYYSGVADVPLFHNDLNFWLTFFLIIVAFYSLWTVYTLEGHVFSCSFLGAYACVAALNYYIGGNLQYIVINSFRRMTVKNFNMATIDPPFQIMDVSQAILWIVMTTFGFYYQMREQRGKPPFPPHRYATVEEGVSERTPLVANNGAVIYSDI